MKHCTIFFPKYFFFCFIFSDITQEVSIWIAISLTTSSRTTNGLSPRQRSSSSHVFTNFQNTNLRFFFTKYYVIYYWFWFALMLKSEKKNAFWTNKEFVSFFNWEILVTKFGYSYWENSWKHVVSSSIDNEKKPIDQDYFCVTEPDSKVPNAPCIFPFHDKGVVYEGCPIDREDKIRRCTMGQKPSWSCIIILCRF